MTDEQRRKLEKSLWEIADTLRGKMNADQFRDYILGFIFFKYLSERMHLYADKTLAQDGLKFIDIDETTEEGLTLLEAVKEESLNNLGYFLRPTELFSEVAKRGARPNQFIIEDLNKILNNIQRSTMGTESEDDFDDLFSDMDLTSTVIGRTEEAKNKLVSKILTSLDGIDFELEDADSDILGDAYEYLIGKFAAGAGKKAGEFYTPQEVSTILARIVTLGKKRIRSVYDPTCGSGSLLLRVARETKVVDFFGQEMNRTTYNLARMNMILHGVHYRNFDLKQEDTLEHPQHKGQTFEAVVANPPFSAKWSGSDLHLNDDRFNQYGKLAPSSKADFAFVQHMIHHLGEKGTMAVVLPHGVLFRGSAEQTIRKYLIEKCNYLDAVIGLPANIFYGTSIPTCILVFKKCRDNSNDNILFIDASNDFERRKNQNILRPSDIDRIIETYRKRKEVDKYAHIASMKEIKENDYNLNIPRYVDTFEEEEPVDLTDVTKSLKQVEKDMKPIDKAIKDFCSELGIESPV